MSAQTIGVRCVQARNVLYFHLPRPLTKREDGETVEFLPLQGKATLSLVHPDWSSLTRAGQLIVPGVLGIVATQQLRTNDPMSFSLEMQPTANDAMATALWKNALPKVIEILRSVQGRHLSVVVHPSFDGCVDHWHVPLITELFGMSSVR